RLCRRTAGADASDGLSCWLRLRLATLFCCQLVELLRLVHQDKQRWVLDNGACHRRVHGNAGTTGIVIDLVGAFLGPAVDVLLQVRFGFLELLGSFLLLGQSALLLLLCYDLLCFVSYFFQ